MGLKGFWDVELSVLKLGKLQANLDKLVILGLNSYSRMERYSAVVVLNLEYTLKSPRET